MKRLGLALLLATFSYAAHADNSLHIKRCPTGFAPMWQKGTSDPKVLVQKCYKYEKPIPGKPVELVDPLK